MNKAQQTAVIAAAQTTGYIVARDNAAELPVVRTWEARCYAQHRPYVQVSPRIKRGVVTLAMAPAARKLNAAGYAAITQAVEARGGHISEQGDDRYSGGDVLLADCPALAAVFVAIATDEQYLEPLEIADALSPAANCAREERPRNYSVIQRQVCETCSGSGTVSSALWDRYWEEHPDDLEDPEATLAWLEKQGCDLSSMANLPLDMEACADCAGMGETCEEIPLHQALTDLGLLPALENFVRAVLWRFRSWETDSDLVDAAETLLSCLGEP